MIWILFTFLNVYNICFLFIDLYTQYNETDTDHVGRRPTANNKSIYLHLWYIANTVTFRQVANLFGVCKSTAWHTVVRVSSWLVEIAHLYLKWPKYATETQQMAHKFETKRKIPHIIGAIDGSHIKIKAPRENPTDYFNRKRYYHKPLQGRICSLLIFIAANRDRFTMLLF